MTAEPLPARPERSNAFAIGDVELRPGCASQRAIDQWPDSPERALAQVRWNSHSLLTAGSDDKTRQAAGGQRLRRTRGGSEPEEHRCCEKAAARHRTELRPLVIWTARESSRGALRAGGCSRGGGKGSAAGELHVRISRQSDQSFRSNPITRFGVFDHRCRKGLKASA